MSRADFKIMCELHAKHFEHKYKEICTCSKRTIRQTLVASQQDMKQVETEVTLLNVNSMHKKLK